MVLLTNWWISFFLFVHWVGNFILPDWRSYFSEGLKPPTRLCLLSTLLLGMALSSKATRIPWCTWPPLMRRVRVDGNNAGDLPVKWCHQTWLEYHEPYPPFSSVNCFINMSVFIVVSDVYGFSHLVRWLFPAKQTSAGKLMFQLPGMGHTVFSLVAIVSLRNDVLNHRFIEDTTFDELTCVGSETPRNPIIYRYI